MEAGGGSHPGGKAACAQSASMAVASGVYGDGLSTQVLPVMVEGISLPPTVDMGKFQG